MTTKARVCRSRKTQPYIERSKKHIELFSDDKAGVKCCLVIED